MPSQTDLRTAINEAAQAGGLDTLTGLTLFRCTDDKTWQGNARRGRDGWRVAMSPDPAEALLKALETSEKPIDTAPVEANIFD